MALLAVYAYFTFQDSKTKSSTTEVKLPLGLTIAEYIDAAQKLATVFVNNTLARLTQVEVCIGLDVTPPASSALADSDVQEKAEFVFVADNGTNYVMYLPTLDESLVAANSDILVQTGNAVEDMITLMTDGDGTVEPVNVRDQDISAISYAREYFRRR